MPISFPARRLLIGLAVSGVTQSAVAGDWRVVPSLSVTENYTDNVLLSERKPAGDFYTTLVPGVAVRGKGRRLNLNADYAAERLWFYNNPELDRTTHRLDGDLALEVVPEHLFLDARGALYPALRSGSGALSNRSRTAFRDRAGLTDPQSNRADVSVWDLTPRYEQQLGTFAHLTASAGFSNTSTDDLRDVGTGRGNDWLARLASGKRFARSDWSLAYRRRDLERAGVGRDSSLQSLLAEFGYRLNRRFRLTGSVGYEDEDYGGDQRAQRGPTGSVGLVYSPGERTSISGSIGQRVFGMTKSFIATHRARHSVVSVSYNEDLRTTAEVLRDRQAFTRRDEFGNPLPIDSGISPDLPAGIDTLGLTDDVFVDRRLNASVGYTHRRDSVSLAVYRLEQESTRSRRHESAVGGGLNYGHQLSRRVSVGVSADYQQRELEQPAGSTDFYAVSPYLSVQLGPHATTRVSYSWMDSQSDFAGSTFTENAVQVALTWAF